MKWRWFGGIFLVLIVLCVCYFFWPMGQGELKLQIKEGQSTKEIADLIAKKSGAYNSQLLFASAAMAGKKTIVSGEYTIHMPARNTEVWQQLYNQSTSIAAKPKLLKRAEITVTFPEGQNVDQTLALLQKSGYTRIDELKMFWTSYNRTLNQSFVFLPSDMRCQYGKIEECVKYYIEGYLAPDTYKFFVDEEPLSVTEKFLQNFARKNSLLIQKSTEEIYRIVTLASVIEKEAGRPGGNINDPVLAQERSLIAGVFGNRDSLGMKWESDPTVTYGVDKPLCQQFRNISDCLYLDDPVLENSRYNTYQRTGMPIGPIANPSSDVLIAALNPKDSNYLFFVADISGKKYFASTYEQHLKNVANLEAINQSLR